MKIEIELNDLGEFLFDDYDSLITTRDIQEKFIERAIEKFAENYFNDSYDYTNAIKNAIYEIVKNNKDKIIENVINDVTKEILKKKDIVNNMPKKSDVANISKELENYFVELIDKAIARRFK